MPVYSPQSEKVRKRFAMIPQLCYIVPMPATSTVPDGRLFQLSRQKGNKNDLSRQHENYSSGDHQQLHPPLFQLYQILRFARENIQYDSRTVQDGSRFSERFQGYRRRNGLMCLPTLPLMLIIGTVLDANDVPSQYYIYLLMGLLSLFSWTGNTGHWPWYRWTA